MNKRNVTLLAIAIILVGMTSLCHAYVAYYSLFVVVGGGNNIYQLKVLPYGQILDTYIQYTNGGNGGFGSGSLAVSPDDRFLFAASGATYRYQIQADGSLVSIGSTNPGGVAFTPNKQLVIGENIIYSLTSTGDLVNGTSSPTIDYPYIDPLGRGVLGVSSFSTFSAYTINYEDKTLSLTTTYPLEVSSPFYFAFTPNGKLGFFYSWVWDSLGVLTIDSIFNVSTSQILNISGEAIDDLAVSSNNRFVWATLFGGGIALFNIDTLGNVTDTGQRYTNGGGIRWLRITPDQQLAIISYEDPQLPSPGGAIATAFINGDGSLSWTGYTFAFDSAHPTEETVVDYAIIPVYATGIPEELWKTPPPEITIHDSQKILN